MDGSQLLSVSWIHFPFLSGFVCWQLKPSKKHKSECLKVQSQVPECLPQAGYMHMWHALIGSWSWVLHTEMSDGDVQGYRKRESGNGCYRGVDKKGVQHESCELSFIWGKMRAAAWETAPQIALRGCSKEAVGRRKVNRGVKCNWVLTLPKIFC